MQRITLLFGGVFLVLLLVYNSLACNEHVCASLVSKCLLLKSCECDMTDKKNCTCCKECHKCLARLYTECCSCVGMCPDHSNDPYELKSSTVEELSDPLPELFKVLTEEEDPYLRWTTFSYPAHLDLLYFKPAGHGNDFASMDSSESAGGQRVHHGGHQVVLDPASQGNNCTVAYMSTCFSLGRCRASCQSMGAARYRWFHAQGCCECIGSTCLDFGKGEPHCLKCPLEEGEEEESDEYDNLMGAGYGYGIEKDDLLAEEVYDDEEEYDDLNVESDVLLKSEDEDDGVYRELDEANYDGEMDASESEKKHRVYGLKDNRVDEVRAEAGGV